MNGRVLLVDDEGSMLFTLSANLEMEGFTVEVADGGKQALEILADHEVDCVLTDIRMPGMSGLDLYRAVRQRGSKVPFVMMTGFAVEGLVEDAIHEGVFTIVSKPFAIDDVVATLLRALRKPSVLIVDSPEEADSVAKQLTAAGLSVKPCYDVASAVRTATDSTVDVCVASLDGETSQLFERMREIDQEISLVAVVGVGDQQALQPVARMIQGAVHKPVVVRDLIRLIAKTRA